MLKLFFETGVKWLALRREVGGMKAHIQNSENSGLLHSPRKNLRGDVEKFSRGVGFLLISLEKEPRGALALSSYPLISLKEEPRGVFVGHTNILMWILEVSGVFSSNAHSAVAPAPYCLHKLYVDHDLP